MEVKFTFDVEFQRALLRLCMLDESFNMKAQHYITPGYFTTESLGWTYKVFQQYFRDFKRRCTDVPLQNALMYADTEHQYRYSAEIKSIQAYGNVVEADYIKKQLKDFISRNMFSKMHRDSAELYNLGKATEAYDLTRRTVDEISQIDFDKPDRSWFFEELPQRQALRQAKGLDPTKDTYTTGIVELDDKLRGGLHKGELFFLMGLAKAGKTTWLINQGFCATFVSRVPTLHINLEGTTEQVVDKYDACIGGEIYYEVQRGNISPEIYRRMLEMYSYLRKNLVIRTFNDWNPTVLTIQGELDELHSSGFDPEVLVVDYLDILRSRERADGETAHQVAAAKDLKRLANSGYGIWSGCQGQRPKKGFSSQELILTSASIADAYAKVRIADGYGSINATQKEKANNECRIYWEDYRDAPCNMLLRLTNDNSRMRMAVGGHAEIIEFDKEDDDDKADTG